MNWYDILRLVLAILKILDLIPQDKRPEAEKGAYKAVAKIVTENNIS